MRDTATVSLRPDVPLEVIPLQYGLDVVSQDLRSICQGKGPCLLSNVGNSLSKTARFALHLHGMRLKDFVEITPAFKLTRCSQHVDQSGVDQDFFLELGDAFGVTSVTTVQQLVKPGFLQPGPGTQRLTRGDLVREAKRMQSSKFRVPGKSGTHSFADGRSKGERAPNGASGYAQNSHRGCSFDP